MVMTIYIVQRRSALINTKYHMVITTLNQTDNYYNEVSIAIG